MGKNKLFTFMCEYNEGTFISQIESNTLTESIKEWVLNIDLKLFDETESNRDDFISEVLEEEPVSIENVKNVWCITPLLNDKLMLIHIIETFYS